MLTGNSNDCGSSCCVHFVTNTARWLCYDDDDDDDYDDDDDDQRGPEVTFKNILLNVPSSSVRQNQECGLVANKCVFERTFKPYLIFVFPCIIIYGFIRTSLMQIV